MQIYRKSVCFLCKKYKKSVYVSNGDSEKSTERLSCGQLPSNFSKYIHVPARGWSYRNGWSAGQLSTKKYQRLTINHHSMKNQQLTTQETLYSHIINTQRRVVFTMLPAWVCFLKKVCVCWKYVDLFKKLPIFINHFRIKNTNIL